MEIRSGLPSSPRGSQGPKRNKNLRRQIDDARLYLTPKFFFGLSLIATALVAAIIINTSSQRTISVWRATEDLAPGSVISAEKIAPTKVLLPENAKNYLSTDAELVGTTVLRSISGDELIPAYSISNQVDRDFLRVPLSIPSSSLPFGLISGNVVDVYAIPASHTAISANINVKSAQLLIASVGIEGIDSNSRDLGGNTTVTLLVPEALVRIVLSGLIDQQIIVVKRIV